MDPAILPDGRMVYAGWLRSPATASRADRVALLGVNEDGTDYQIYAGDEGLRVKQMPAPTANGLVVFVEADGDRGRRLGPARLGEPGAPAAHLPLADRRGATASSARRRRCRTAGVLVAWRPRRRGRGHASAIYRFDPATGAREKAFERSRLALACRRSSSRPRPMPDARSSVVRDDDPEGKLYTIDVGIQAPRRGSCRRAAAKTPAGRRGRARDGRSARVRRLLGERPDRRRRLLPGAGPGEHAGAAAARSTATASRCAPRPGSGCATTRRRAASAATRTRSARRRTG